jgi:hypothetical protein
VTYISSNNCVQNQVTQPPQGQTYTVSIYHHLLDNTMPKKKGSKKPEQKISAENYPFQMQDPCIVAKSGKFTYVEDGDDGHVLEEKYCHGLKKKSSVLDFQPDEFKTALKLTGYEGLSNKCRHTYGKGGKYMLFTYTRTHRKEWLNKSQFRAILGARLTDKYILESKLIESANVHEHEVDGGHKKREGSVRRTIEREIVPRTMKRRGRKVESDSSEADSASGGSNESSSDDQTESRKRKTRKSKLSSRTRRSPGSVSSDTDSATGDSSESGSDDQPAPRKQTARKSTPLSRSRRSAGSVSSDTDSASEDSSGSGSDDEPAPRKQTARKSTPSSPSPTSRSRRNNIFARRIYGKIQNIYINTDGVYDMEQLDHEPNYIHKESNEKYAPQADRDFITSLIISEKLKPSRYTLLGCVGFETGVERMWQVAIFELKEKYALQLQKFRRKKGVKYAGPALVPLSFFKDVMKGDRIKAEEYFDKTTLGKQNRRAVTLGKGADHIRTLRYGTLEPEDTQAGTEKLRMKLEGNYDMGIMNEKAEKEWEDGLRERVERMTLDERETWSRQLKKKAKIVRSSL